MQFKLDPSILVLIPKGLIYPVLTFPTLLPGFAGFICLYTFGTLPNPTS